MSFEGKNRESDKNRDSKGKDDKSVDFTKNIVRQKEAKKAVESNDEYSSKIWGSGSIKNAMVK